MDGHVIGMLEQENFLEIGFVLFGLGILAGIAALLYGQTRGSSRQGEQRAQKPPRAGSVSIEQHRNIQTVSAR